MLYQDDFKTNNPLGSHKGAKIGAVYIAAPCLPVNMLSKTGNILVLTLCNSSDDKKVTLSEIFAKAVQELQFLENEGIFIQTPSGMMRLYFALAGFIGDNLASHTILGFLKSFSSNHPCRF